MPIYEYLCSSCNRIYSFMMHTMEPERAPKCPRCGSEGLEKQVSLFAFVRGGTDPLAAIPKQEAEDETITGEDAGAPVRDDGLYWVDDSD